MSKLHLNELWNKAVYILNKFEDSSFKLIKKLVTYTY